MPEQERQILQELFTVAAFAGVIACMVFAFIRRQRPELGWNNHGNVWTSPFGMVEGLFSCLVFFLALVLITATPAEPPAPTVAGVLQGSLIFGSIAGFVVLYFGWTRKIDLTELFGLRRLKGWRLIGIACAWFVPAGLAGMATKYGFDQFVWRTVGIALEDQDLVTALREGGVALKVAIFVSAVVMAPLTEEILFRGLLYTTTKRYTERYFAAIFSALAFGLLHANLSSFAPLVVLGMFFALAYEITGCLTVPILMHSLFNATSILLILKPELFEQLLR